MWCLLFVIAKYVKCWVLLLGLVIHVMVVHLGRVRYLAFVDVLWKYKLVDLVNLVKSAA